MNKPFPIVRLTLEHMQYEIVNAVGMHLDEMKGQVEAEVRRAVDAFDFGGAVREIAFRTIQAELERAVKDAISHAVWTDDVRGALKKTAAEELSKIGVM